MNNIKVSGNSNTVNVTNICKMPIAKEEVTEEEFNKDVLTISEMDHNKIEWEC